MRFRCLWSVLIGFLISSGLLLGDGATWKALLCTGEADFVIPVEVPSNIVESSVSVPSPLEVAITPDGTRALVTSSNDTVTVLDITQPIIGPGYAVPVGNSPLGVAITPDGNRSLVANFADNTVSVLELNPTVHVIDTVSVPGGPRNIAITPDGSKAFVCTISDGTVTVLSLNPTVQVLYTIQSLGSPRFIAITPDGTKGLVADSDNNEVRVFDLTQSIVTSGQAVSGIPNPNWIAIAPDGRLALVTSSSSTGVSVLDLTKSTIVPGYSVTLASSAESVAITPDGTKAYVALDKGQVAVLDLTQTPIQSIDSISLSFPLLGIAITPDQAPIAAFTMSANGLTVLFDGSTSSSPVGNIKEYTWDFGDGSAPVTTTSASVSHTYAKSAAYTVTLTVVNDAGTSLDVTFTGQTMSNHGLPRARLSQVLNLRPLPPHKFVGKVHKHDGKLYLKTKWHPSTDKGTKKYEITARNRKKKVIYGRKSDHATIKLHPHHVPPRASKKYRLYLHDKYAISSVNASGIASRPVHVHVKD